MDGEVFRLVSQAEGEVGGDGDSYQSQSGFSGWRGRIGVTFQLYFWKDMILGNFLLM